MRKRWLIGFSAALVVAIAIGVNIARRPVPGQPAVTPARPGGVDKAAARPAVSVAVASFASLQETASFHGTLAPNARVAVNPKGAGRVARVAVKLGDQVKRGDVLVQLETSELSLQVKQAEAALASAKANLQRTLAGALPEEIAQAQAALDQAEANYVNARLNADRANKLRDQGVMSQKDWDAVNAQFEVTKAQVVAAEKRLALVKEGARAEDIEVAKAAVAQAEAALSLAKLQLENATIKAPIDGLVAQVNVEVGDMATSAVPVVSIVDNTPLRLELQVSEKDIMRLRKGQPVRVQVDALPQVTAEGKVAGVGPAADPQTGLFQVNIEIANENQALKPGMYGTAYVVVGLKERALAIPADAVFAAEGKSFVYVVQDGVAHARSITVGMRDGNRVEVVAGLRAGEEVIVAGREFVTDGAAVEVVKRGSEQ